MELALTFGIVVCVVAFVWLISQIPLVSDALDFLAEIASGPRFVYMGWPWIFSSSFRRDLRREHSTRNPLLAYAEYLLALVSFVVQLLLMFLVSSALVTKLLGPA